MTDPAQPLPDPPAPAEPQPPLPDPDPTAIRTEVEEDLEDLEREAAEQEAKRMAERDAEGVDEPR